MSDAAEPLPAGRAANRAPAGPQRPGGSAGAPAGREAGISHAFAAGVLALLMGLQPITTDLMLPALPALAADLHAPMAPVQLTMSALILAFGLAQLVWGPVADRVGRRPVLLLGLALYTLASLGAAQAGSVMAVVVWRALQGAAMSAAVVCARAMVRDLYEPQEGAMVMARALSRFSTKVTSCRDTWNRAPSAMKIPSAWMAGQGFSGTPEAMASTRQPAATGMDTSTRVEAMRTPSSMPNNLGESSQ